MSTLDQSKLFQKSVFMLRSELGKEKDGIDASVVVVPTDDVLGEPKSANKEVGTLDETLDTGY